MAYPLEDEHVEYLDYVESYSMGKEGDGPKMSKDQWRAMKKVKPKRGPDGTQPGIQRRPKKGETVGSLVDDMGGYA